MKPNQKGQTVVEFSLMLMFFMFLVFAIFGISMMMIEEKLGYYAAFMASRSYEVYGNRDEESGFAASASLGKIYQTTFYNTLSSSYPYIIPKKDKVSIIVDTYVKTNQPQAYTSEFPDFSGQMDAYNLNTSIFPKLKLAVDVPTDATTPRFGLMKVKFPTGFWFLPELGISNLDYHEITVPYRLEVYTDAHVQ